MIQSIITLAREPFAGTCFPVITFSALGWNSSLWYRFTFLQMTLNVKAKCFLRLNKWTGFCKSSPSQNWIVDLTSPAKLGRRSEDFTIYFGFRGNLAKAQGPATPKVSSEEKKEINFYRKSWKKKTPIEGWWFLPKNVEELTWQGLLHRSICDLECTGRNQSS